MSPVRGARQNNRTARTIDVPTAVVGAAWIALVVAVTGFGACGNEASSAGAGDPRARIRSDHRIQDLLRDCPESGFYDRDLSNWVAILIEKLERGKTEPLKRAKEELGLLGPEAAAELYRFVDRHFASAMHAPLVENAVDAAGFNMTDEGHQVLLRALRHPQESVRRQALIGLAARHARPEDFEILLERIEGYETPELRRVALRALFLADRARAEARVLDWVEQQIRRDLWMNAIPSLPASTEASVQARAAELFAELDPLLAIYLAAAAARGGHEEALGFLRDKLTPSTPQNLRTAAVQAAAKAGLYAELAPVITRDPVEAVRILAVDGIATGDLSTKAIEGYIAGSLDDASPLVRGLALKHLASFGHAEARARALSMLAEEGAALQAALQGLQEPLRTEPEFARLVWERLLERHALEEHRPIQKRTATFKAMGLVPLAQAALFLHELGVTYDRQEIESLRAHEWLMIQASNTGLPGRSALYAELAQETDPLRRLDLIHAVGSVRDDFARDSLIELLTKTNPGPYELLFIASRLVRIGPSWEVAPLLKRASYAMEDIEARVSLQCLLWHWY